MISADFASIEVDIQNKQLNVIAKTTMNDDKIVKIIKEVVKVTNQRALDIATDYKLKINYKNLKK